MTDQLRRSGRPEALASIAAGVANVVAIDAVVAASALVALA